MCLDQSNTGILSILAVGNENQASRTFRFEYMRLIHLYRTELPMRRGFQALFKPPLRSSERLCRRCIFPDVSQPGHTLFSFKIIFVRVILDWSSANNSGFPAQIGGHQSDTAFLDLSRSSTVGQLVW